MQHYYSLLATIFSCLTVAYYLFNLTKGKAILNPTTWIIWSFVGVLNVSTYLLLSKMDLAKSIPLIIVVGGILMVTAYAFINGQCKRPSKLDIFCGLFSVLVLTIWMITKNSIMANILLQVVFAISVIPTILGLRNGSLRETVGPWLISLIGYTFMIAHIGSTWHEHSWVELLHPIVKGFVGNGLIAYYAYKMNNKKPIQIEVHYSKAGHKKNLGYLKMLSLNKRKKA